MNSHPWWVKVARAAAVAAGVLLICALAFVQVQQRLLRWRAERLLADIRAIQMGKSTPADVQSFMDRWKRWSYSRKDCSLESCRYGVELQDGLSTAWNAYDEYSRVWKILVVPYWLAGGRAILVTADLKIEYGAVEESSFGLFSLGSPQLHSDPREPNAVATHATEFASGFDPYEFQEQRLLHPEYWIGKPGGCEGCVKLDTGFSPLVDKAKMLELTGFSLSCITRWSTCTHESDILPAAWNQYQAELKGDDLRTMQFENCQVPLEFWGREYQNIAIGDAINVNPEVIHTLGGGAYRTATLRIVRVLKGNTAIKAENVYETEISDPEQAIEHWGSADVTRGHRYIFLGSFYLSRSKTVELDLDRCGVVPFNEANLKSIEKGIDESRAREAALKKLRH